jgi:hypothetical protein
MIDRVGAGAFCQRCEVLGDDAISEGREMAVIAKIRIFSRCE